MNANMANGKDMRRDICSPPFQTSQTGAEATKKALLESVGLKAKKPPPDTAMVSIEGLFRGLPDYLPSISSPSACPLSLALTGSLERT